MKYNRCFICVVLLLLSLVCGCGKDKKTEIVLTTDFEEGEVFRIEKASCMLPEVMVYLVNSENKYNEIFTDKLWEVPIDGTTMENKYKDTVLARLAQIKVMNLLAASREITLNDDDILRVKSAARDYYNSLNEDEKQLMYVDEDIIYNMYYEFAIADKLYHEITDEVTPEISDDEARIVTLRSILIKTYKIRPDGSRIDYNESEKQNAYERISDIKRRLDEGNDFDIIAESTENEDSRIEYRFSRDVMPQNIEELALSMSIGDISGIVESDYGYHIFKCISTYDEEQTDKNKEAILKRLKQEAFDEVYDEFLVNLNSNLNGNLWDAIVYNKNPNVTTTDFFEIYDNYFVPVTGESVTE